MRILLGLLLLVEAAICFGPIALIYAMGLMFYPVSAANAILDYDLNSLLDMSPMLFMVIGGSFGIIGLGITLIQYTFQGIHFISTEILKSFTLLGTLALLAFGLPIQGSGSDWFWFTFALPLLATAHIYWIALRPRS